MTRLTLLASSGALTLLVGACAYSPAEPTTITTLPAGVAGDPVDPVTGSVIGSPTAANPGGSPAAPGDRARFYDAGSGRYYDYDSATGRSEWTPD